MPQLSKLKNRSNPKDVVIDFGGGDVLTVTLDANKFTYRLQKEMTRAVDDGDADRIAELFFTPVDAWDLTDDDGNVLPMTAATIDDLGVATVREIFTKISGVLNPNASASTS